MDKGFIVLYRDIFDWEWFDDVYVFKLFVCLIMMASHKTKRYKGKSIKRGAFVTSIASLSEKTKMSETSVKSSLKKLTQTGEIEQEIVPNQFRIITIKNYNKYQSVGFLKTDNKTNSKTDNKTTINNGNKCVCPTDTHTQQSKKNSAACALGERAAAVQPTCKDVREYQISHRAGCGECASEFYDAFVKTKTLFPPDWEDVYHRYAKAPPEKQDEFLKMLESGQLREKWGTAE